MKLCVFFTCFLLLTSCASIQLELTKDKSILGRIKTMNHPTTKKQIVFLPVVHLGSANYFKSVKFAIDSLRQHGFSIIYEGIGLNTPLDSTQNDLIDRKLRQVIGFHLTHYKDSTNKSVAGGLRNSKYVMQTKNNTGIDMKHDLKVDLPKDSLIALYEQRKGSILLSPCDLNTPLLAKYNCKTPKNTRKNILLLDIRDEHVVNYILQSKKQKIAILYGKKHWTGIFPSLYKKGFRLVE